VRGSVPILVLGVGILTATTPALAQLPPGYALQEAIDLPVSLEEEHLDGRFRISIDRTASSDRERSLIRMVERLYPTSDLIGEVVSEYLRTDSHSGPLWQQHFRRASDAPGPRWWWLEWDDTWLPYALTASAVGHYMDRVRDLSSVPNPFDRSEPAIEHTAEFTYRAAVNRAESGDQLLTEVKLEASWSFYCGRRCALRFEHTRRVLIDHGGRVVSVEGDGPPRWIVS